MKKSRGKGIYVVTHQGTHDVYERMKAGRVSVVLPGGAEIRVSQSRQKGHAGIEIYSSDGRLIVWPDVSNVITVGVEGN